MEVQVGSQVDSYLDLLAAYIPRWQVEQAGEMRELPGFKA